MEDESDNISLVSYYSAAGTAKFDQSDEQYFSDSNTAQSFYETIRSDSSTVDLTDFQSFENSLKDSDSDSSTIGSPEDFPSDSDTEVEEAIIVAAK
mgnify:CR=1 FL=1